MSSKGRVLLAMSGGVDSSVAGIMLHNEGYEVVGITMKTWEYASKGASQKVTGCCSLDSVNDARAVAVSLGFPHYVLDLQKEFEELIISNFVDEYLVGNTPNPCVLCNTHIKWSALLKRADMLDCEFIATGHYAKLRKEKNRMVLSRGLDSLKDQSYVLWGLSQENLARTLLPLGGYTKEQIKEIARKNDFFDIADKRESYEICFIPDNDYRSFLNERVEGVEEKYKGGDFLSVDGEVLGKHKGFPYYTIGQRKGLEIALGRPMYVKEINAENNTVVLDDKEGLFADKMKVTGVNLVKYDVLPAEMKVVTKIRYHDKGEMSTIKVVDDKICVQFDKPVSAITSGQSAVFYENDDVIGGGIICR